MCVGTSMDKQIHFHWHICTLTLQVGIAYIPRGKHNQEDTDEEEETQQPYKSDSDGAEDWRQRRVEASESTHDVRAVRHHAVWLYGCVDEIVNGCTGIHRAVWCCRCNNE